MAGTFLVRRLRDSRPDMRTTTTNDGVPQPTGYFPDRSNPQQGQVTTSPLFEAMYADRGTIDPVEVQRVDQHPWLQVDATWTPPVAGPRRDGRNDPLTSGPARPTPRLLGLFFNYTQGNSHTGLDDVPGRKFNRYGSQDGASTVWYADPSRQMAPYQPDPATGQNPDSLRSILAGPAHGWTAQPVFNVKAVENAKALQLLQQQPGRNDRLAPSTYAGQTFSNQTTKVANPAGAAPVPSRRSRG